MGCKEGSQRQDTDKLPCYRHDQGVNTVSKGLEGRTQDNTVTGKYEAEADNAQCRYSNGDHLFVCLEKSQHNIRL